MKGPIDKGITFELPRHSLVESCKYSIFDDLLIGNFMKTKLYNLKSLYDPVINFNNIVFFFKVFGYHLNRIRDFFIVIQ